MADTGIANMALVKRKFSGDPEMKSEKLGCCKTYGRSGTTPVYNIAVERNVVLI